MASPSSAAARYVDAGAYEAFADHDGQEFTVSALVAASVDEAFDAWVQQEWLGRGKTLTPGDGRGCLGNLRRVDLGVEEEMVSVGLPVADSAQIPTLCYKIRRSGPLLLQDHVALVQFVADATAPDDSPRTLVLWSGKLTPSAVGSVLLCGGSLTRMVLRTVLSRSLAAIAASFASSKPKRT